MYYFLLSCTLTLRSSSALLTAGAFSLVLTVASQHRVDLESGSSAMPIAGIAMLMAWIVTNLLIADTSSVDAGLPVGLRRSPAPVQPLALFQWRLGELVVVVALSIAFVPMGWIVIHPPGFAGIALLELLLVTVISAAAALVTTILSSVLPRAAAAAAGGAWLLLCSGAANPTDSSLARVVTAPLFPLSQALVGTDEAAHRSGSLQSIGSVALLDLGLLLLLVAIELRRRR